MGKLVTYCRMRTDPKTMKSEPHEGVGNVVGIFLSADQRPQVRVLDGKETYNIDLMAINTTPQGKQRYYEHVAAIFKYSDEANAKINKMTEDANKHLHAMNDIGLGPVLKMETAEENDNEPVPEAIAQ